MHVQGQQEFMRGPDSMTTEVASTSYSSKDTERRSTVGASAQREGRNNVGQYSEETGEGSARAVLN